MTAVYVWVTLGDDTVLVSGEANNYRWNRLTGAYEVHIWTERRLSPNGWGFAKWIPVSEVMLEHPGHESQALRTATV